MEKRVRKPVRRGHLELAYIRRSTVGYTRVSTDDQREKGGSLRAQESRIRAWGHAAGREVHEVISESSSAKTLRREEIKKLIARIRQREIGVIVVVKLDRLTRSVRDLGNLLELFAKFDVAIVSVTESIDTTTAGGRMVMNLLTTVAQWEREVIAERTALVLAHKRDAGEAYSPYAPFGFRRIGDKFEPVAEELAAVKRAIDMRRRGSSLREIARWLEAKGFRTPQKGRVRWHAASVKAMLTARARS